VTRVWGALVPDLSKRAVEGSAVLRTLAPATTLYLTAALSFVIPAKPRDLRFCGPFVDKKNPSGEKGRHQEFAGTEVRATIFLSELGKGLLVSQKCAN
jgi:hypothetical protein